MKTKILFIFLFLIASCGNQSNLKFIKCYDPVSTLNFDNLSYDKYEFHINKKENLIKVIEIYSDSHVNYLRDTFKLSRWSFSEIKNDLREFKIKSISTNGRIIIAEGPKYPRHIRDDVVANIIFDTKEKNIKFFNKDKDFVNKTDSFQSQLICK